MAILPDGLVLAIESSCDESAAALFDPRHGLTGEWVHSQIERHQPYGGVVPDLASREHLVNLPLVVEQALAQANDLAAIAVTHGPGLPGCLALGISLAQSLALARRVPVFGVNHLRGHAFSPFFPIFESHPATFGERFDALLPHLGLLVSGGNTVLFRLEHGGRITLLAQTADDAAGEALDKGAKLLGLPYPGGPEVEKLARKGAPDAFAFPRAFRESADLGFSFSGLKTSLRYTIEKLSDADLAARLPDLCASYQAAVVDALLLQTERALSGGTYRSLGLSGGVANNGPLRERFLALGNNERPALLAERRHTGDNAGMIAFAAWADQDHVESVGTATALPLDPALPLA